MTAPRLHPVGAEVVVPGEPLDETLQFFVERLGFRLDAIHPADRPRVAVISGFGITLRLDPDVPRPGPALRLRVAGPGAGTTFTAPNGSTVHVVDADPGVELPELRAARVISRARDADGWHEGRAGMQYRDLVPDRQGGRFVVSHIRIPGGGPVPDYVHFHRIRFQLIFCRRGWVEVVYEDQGPAFVLHPGDCVLQPPGIRHRVLRSSPDLEVVELGSPADHETLADPDLELPTGTVRPDRRYGDQRFVRHVAAGAAWATWHDGFLRADTGIRDATGGALDVTRVRVAPGAATTVAHPGELLFLYVLDGELGVEETGRRTALVADDALVVEPSVDPRLSGGAAGADVLVVEVPGVI